MNLGDLESDTESINTPSTSPSHRGRNSNRDSDISFGLHSPEGLPANSGHEALQVSDKSNFDSYIIDFQVEL